MLSASFKLLSFYFLVLTFVGKSDNLGIFSINAYTSILSFIIHTQAGRKIFEIPSNLNLVLLLNAYFRNG